jgi:hypothetical protein
LDFSKRGSWENCIYVKYNTFLVFTYIFLFSS